MKRDYREAFRRYASSVNASSRLVNVEGPQDSARTYYNLGLALEKLGNYSAEDHVMQRARSVARAAGDRQTELLARKSLAEAKGFRGDYSALLAALDEMLPEADKELPRGAVAGIHRSLSTASGALGDFERQKREAELSRELSRSTSDTDGEAAALLLLASVHSAQAEYALGLQLLDEARKVLIRSREPDLAPLHFARGDLLRACGRYREALLEDQKAHRLATDSRIEEAEAVAESRLGIDSFLLGRVEEARAHFAAAREIHRALGARDDEALQLYYLGRVAASRRNWTEATRWLSEAKTCYATQGLVLGEAVVGLALAEPLREIGRGTEALELLTRAASVFKTSGERNGQAEAAVETALTLQAMGREGEARQAALGGVNASDPDLRWRANFAAGRASRALGRRPEAVDAFRKAIADLEALRQDLKLASLQSGFTASRLKLALYSEMVTTLVESGRSEEAFEYVERSRARAFLDQLGNRALDAGPGADGAKLAEERSLAGRILELSNRLQQGYASPDSARMAPALERLASEIDRLRSLHQRAVEELAMRDPRLGDLVTVKPLTLAEVQRHIPADTTLLEYFVAADRLFAWTIRRSSARLTVTTVPGDELISRANQLRVALEHNLPMADKVSRQLHGWLIAPVASELATERIWVVPHLSLHYVPFAALVGDDGRYLVQRHVFSTFPAASALKLAPAAPPELPSTLLAVGNPTLETTGEALPFAEEEVRKIQSQFTSKVLTGPDATEAAFRRMLAGPAAPDLVHLACHAELDPVNPMFSAILLASGDGHDGELTVQDVYGLRVPASVVTLSACDTALGPVSQGDEMTGLTRAFLHAGARAVVASLWQVNDEATAALAAVMYRHLRSGRRAEALRAAQLELLQAPYGPHYWAAFAWTGL